MSNCDANMNFEGKLPNQSTILDDIWYYSLIFKGGYTAIETERCSNEFKIGEAKVETNRSNCEAKCDNTDSCSFYFFSDKDLCILYSECNTSFKMAYGIGNTYKKIGKSVMNHNK